MSKSGKNSGSRGSNGSGGGNGKPQALPPSKSGGVPPSRSAAEPGPPFGAGGVGRLIVDGKKVAEGEIPRTAAFGYSLDETFDVGCDQGAPVTDEYPALAAFTGKIVKIDIDLRPDLAIDANPHGAEQVKAALLRQ